MDSTTCPLTTRPENVVRAGGWKLYSQLGSLGMTSTFQRAMVRLTKRAALLAAPRCTV